MTDATDRIKILIIKHLKNELNAGEYDELQAWVGSSDENQVIFDQLTDPDRLEQDLKEFHEAKVNIRGKIDARLRKPEPVYQPGIQPLLYSSDPAAPSVPVIPLLTRRTWVYAAAACAILLLAGGYLLMSRHTKPGILTNKHPIGNDVLPGSNKAILVLANGHRILLDKVQAANIENQEGSQIAKLDSGQITYRKVSGQSTTPPLIATYNTLETPPAGQFRVTLPDGTKVWLNNSSSLKYPIAFIGQRRQVELSGEGYFEVTRNAEKPFHVLVRGIDVGVLGTSFNVNAYANEASINTTLVQGSVSVAQKTSKQVLQPGEQAQVDEKGQIIKVQVNTDRIIAWKNGFFNFDQSDFKAVMRQLARWYDMEVVYQGAIPDNTFYGRIDRSLTLSQVLKIFENQEFHFVIEGRKLIVISDVK